jgi:hypothetical protein
LLRPTLARAQQNGTQNNLQHKVNKMISLVKKMDHSEYIANTRKMTLSSLEYVRQDAAQAYSAFPDGPNAGYYADEVHYCSMEIKRRKVDN